MVDLNDKRLNKELEELESQDIPSLEEIKDQNKKLEKLEKDFEKSIKG